MKVEQGVLGDIEECLPIVKNMETELRREMEYNDRKDSGNAFAPHLFREQWEAFRASSPLCSMAVTIGTCTVDDQQLIGMKGPAKAVIVAINEVDELFGRYVEEPEQARDFIAELYRRICYLCEKLYKCQKVAE